MERDIPPRGRNNGENMRSLRSLDEGSFVVDFQWTGPRSRNWCGIVNWVSAGELPFFFFSNDNLFLHLFIIGTRIFLPYLNVLFFYDLFIEGFLIMYANDANPRSKKSIVLFYVSI